MSKLEYKLLPCVFCTIGFNSYVAVNKLAFATSNKLKGQKAPTDSGNENKTFVIRNEL